MHNRQCPSGSSKQSCLVGGCLRRDLCMQGSRSAPPASQAASRCTAGETSRQHSTPAPVDQAARSSASQHRQQPRPMSKGSHLVRVHKLFEEERCSDGPTHAAANIFHVCRAAHGSRWSGTDGPTAVTCQKGSAQSQRTCLQTVRHRVMQEALSCTFEAATVCVMQPNPRQLGALGGCDSTHQHTQAAWRSTTTSPNQRGLPRACCWLAVPADLL